MNYSIYFDEKAAIILIRSINLFVLTGKDCVLYELGQTF